MALWDLFKKKQPAQQQPESTGPRLEDYIDLRVEVTSNLNNALLFSARIDSVQGDEAELYQYTDSALPEEKEISEPLSVTMRGFLDKARVKSADNMAVIFTARILPVRPRVWKADQMRLQSVAKGRAYFRLDVNVDAVTAPIRNNIAAEKPCKVVNISVGGACVATSQVYKKGDRFLLKVKLLPDRPVSRLYCKVLRIVEKENSQFEYGCQFVELDDAARSRISQDILAAQLALRKKQA